MTENIDLTQWVMAIGYLGFVGYIFRDRNFYLFLFAWR